MGNLSRALAGEAARNLQAVDVLLRDTANAVLHKPVARHVLAQALADAVRACSRQAGAETAR